MSLKDFNTLLNYDQQDKQFQKTQKNRQKKIRQRAKKRNNRQVIGNTTRQ